MEHTGCISGTGRIMALAVAGSLLLAGAGYAQGRPAPRVSGTAQRISVNFSDVSVRQVLATIADYARADVLVTPGATGNISINLRNRTPDEAIRLVAATAGLSVVRVGTSYVVGPGPEVKKAASEFGETIVVPLQHLTPAEVVEILNRAAPTVTVQAGKTGVVLSGLPADVEEARAALRELDVRPEPPSVPVPPPPPIETDVVVARYTDAAELERVLREAFPEVRITRQDRSLILNGPRPSLEAAARAVRSIDVEPPAAPEAPPEPEPRLVEVYRLSYLNAVKAEEALKKALPELNVTAAPEPTAPPPANFVPLSLSFLGGGSGGGGFGGGGFGGGGFGGGGFGGGGGGFGGGGGGLGGGMGGGQGGVEQQPLSRSTRLVLIGTRAEIETARRILIETDIAPPHVNIEAEVIDIDRTNTKDLGVLWDFSGTGATFSLEPGDAFQFGRITRSATSLRVSLQALIEQRRARLLARPNISVVDNEDANIFIGDLVRFRGAIVVTPDVGTVQGTETIPVGIALLVRPRIHPDGSVTLKVHPVVSSVSDFLDGLPQTASREADTTIRLNEGEALVIGGLLRDDEVRSLRKVPGLGDLPLIGELFRSRTRSRSNREIVIIVRARAVMPAPAVGAPPAPLEAPK
jgi:type II secretory pathway component GspD/PulD (secretin)